jgi:Leucine-rich repeat (LRR) protein
VTSKSLKGLNVLELQNLDISQCNKLDKTFFERFKETDRLPLKYLKLSFIDNIVESSDLVEIFKRSPNLKILDMESIKFPKEKNPQSIFEALDSCFSLTKFNFSGVTSPHSIIFSCTDKEWVSVVDLSIKNFRPRDHIGFQQIISKCSNIKYLDISNNPQITQDMLKMILFKIKKCKKIRMELSHQISEKGLDQIREEYKDIIFLRNIARRVKAKDSGLRVPIPKKKADWPQFGKKKKKR